MSQIYNIAKTGWQAEVLDLRENFETYKKAKGIKEKFPEVLNQFSDLFADFNYPGEYGSRGDYIIIHFFNNDGSHFYRCCALGVFNKYLFPLFLSNNQQKIEDYIQNNQHLLNPTTTLFYTEPYKKAIADFKVYPKERGIEYTALGLCGEVGEICNEIKKSIRNDNGVITPERKERLIDELGDVLWYLQALVDETGIDLNEVAVRNIEKLTKRKSDNNLKHE